VKLQRSKRLVRREIFVLTPGEKKTICFVLIAFALGLATAHYRAAHSVPPLKTAINETATTAARTAQKRAESKRLKAAQ
jgi:hypothetical protein